MLLAFTCTGLVVDLALQLSRLPAPLGPRLLRAYSALPPPLLADLISANNGPAPVEAAVEALLVQPLQVRGPRRDWVLSWRVGG